MVGNERSPPGNLAGRFSRPVCDGNWGVIMAFLIVSPLPSTNSDRGELFVAFKKIRRLGFARVAILLVLVLTMIPAVARISAAKPPPPPPTGSSFARAYSVPYSYSVAESISQASSGGFAVGAICSAGANTTPNCNGPATVLRVDSSGNIQSQTQYSYGIGPQSTATSDGGAIFAG